MPNRIRQVLSCLVTLLLLFGNGVSTAADLADSQARVSGPQSLRQLQAFALAHNPEVSAGVFDQQAAQARTSGAAGARLPRLTIEGGYNRYDPDLRLTAASYNGELGVFGNNIFNADLVLRLPLFAGGRLVAEVRAAELLEASAGQRLARSRSDLLFNVASLYYGLLAQQRLIASLEHAEQALGGHLGQVQSLIAGRKAAAVDGLRSEVKLADIRQRRLREQNIMAIQRQSLFNLLGAESAITVTPMLTAALLEKMPVATSRGRFELLFERVIVAYGRLLTHMLAQPSLSASCRWLWRWRRVVRCCSRWPSLPLAGC